MNVQKAHTILVVDDEPSICSILKKLLTSWNFKVITAENGHRAITLIESHTPDAVITDLYMPGGNGFELLDHIKKTEPDLPVVVMSGQGERDDVIQALRLGAWDYLYKPIGEMSFLRLTIKRILEKARLVKENQAYREHLEELVRQKSAELLASEKRYRTVAEFTYNWEYWVAPEGDIVYMSPSCERITGYSTREFVQNPSLLYDITHPGDRVTFKRHLDDCHLKKEVFHLDLRIVRRDGEQRWIGHSSQPVSDSEGNYLGLRCSNRDVTYQKKIENDLIRQQHDLLNKTKSQEKSNEALKVLLDQREVEKKSIEQTMVANLKRYVFPYLKEVSRLKIGKDAKAYVSIINTNIEQLISPVSMSLSGAYLKLTPTEIKVADLIRQGRATKSIAALLKTSSSTVEKHRNKIRKKFKILNKKINLHTHLNSLT